MASVTHITNYLARARSRLLLQFQNLPRIDGFLQAWEQEIQAVEDAMYTVYFDRLLQNAVVVGDDDLLNKLGDIVGLPRLGLSNSQYLVAITAKIAANRSGGKREDLIHVMSLLTPNTTIVLNELYPKSVSVYPLGPITFSPYLIVQWFLDYAKEAATRIALIWTQVSAANTITPGSTHNASFSAGPPTTNTGVTSTQSFGSVYNLGFAAGPPVSNAGGGVLAGVVQG